MNKINNLNAIRTVASALADLNLKVVYISGPVASLYSNSPEVDDANGIEDGDIVLELACLTEMEKIRESLMEKGFTQTSADKEACRFHYEGIIVEIINTQDTGLAAGNPWFNKAFIYLEQKRIEEIKIIILPFAYFLAVKFSAMHDRGRNDPDTSHDFEDIIYVLDNRTNFVDVILSSPEEVQKYLKEEFQSIIESKRMQEALFGKLQHPVQTERFNGIMDKLHRITHAVN